MESLELWLFAVGTADLVSDFSGRPTSVVRSVMGVAVAAAATSALAVLLGHPAPAAALLAVLVGAGVATWLLLHWGTRWSMPRAGVALAFLGACTLGFAGTVNHWRGDGGVLAAWLASLPYGVAETSVDRTLFGIGVTVCMLGTGNAAVRLLLAIAKDGLQQGEDTLRGGRMIGAFERLLLLWLAVSGEVAAAVLVVSAKSVLRFPEISSKRDGGAIDTLTEYALVGSLASWVFALWPLVFLA